MSKIELTVPERRTLDQAKKMNEFSPTQIGMALNHPQHRASSKVAPAIRRLAEVGYLARHEHGHNQVTYTVTSAGRDA